MLTDDRGNAYQVIRLSLSYDTFMSCLSKARYGTDIHRQRIRSDLLLYLIHGVTKKPHLSITQFLQMSHVDFEELDLSHLAEWGPITALCFRKHKQNKKRSPNVTDWTIKQLICAVQEFVQNNNDTVQVTCRFVMGHLAANFFGVNVWIHTDTDEGMASRCLRPANPDMKGYEFHILYAQEKRFCLLKPVYVKEEQSAVPAYYALRKYQGHENVLVNAFYPMNANIHVCELPEQESPCIFCITNASNTDPPQVEDGRQLYAYVTYPNQSNVLYCGYLARKDVHLILPLKPSAESIFIVTATHPAAAHRVAGLETQRDVIITGKIHTAPPPFSC